MKNQKGFSSVEILLLLILVAIIGFTGYFVYHSQKTATKILDTATTSYKTSNTGADETTSWTSYSSTTGQFSLKYPSSWDKASDAGCVEDSILLLGPKGFAGHCASDATPEIFVTSVPSDKRPDYQYKTADYPNLKKEAVTINGVQGDKLSGTQNTGQDIMVGPPNGTKAVGYVFYTNGRTYVATYNQTPTSPDVLAQFNLMVTKTWQFHS